MKKFLTVAIAAIFAIVFSAFTPAEKPAQPYYYFVDSSPVIYNQPSPCPDGDEFECTIDDNGTPRPLYTQATEHPDYLLKWE